MDFPKHIFLRLSSGGSPLPQVELGADLPPAWGTPEAPIEEGSSQDGSLCCLPARMQILAVSHQGKELGQATSCWIPPSRWKLSVHALGTSCLLNPYFLPPSQAVLPSVLAKNHEIWSQKSDFLPGITTTSFVISEHNAAESKPGEQGTAPGHLSKGWSRQGARLICNWESNWVEKVWEEDPGESGQTN